MDGLQGECPRQVRWVSADTRGKLGAKMGHVMERHLSTGAGGEASTLRPVME